MVLICCSCNYEKTRIIVVSLCKTFPVMFWIIKKAWGKFIDFLDDLYSFFLGGETGMNNILVGVMFSIFLRWGTALHDYSGQKQPPMYGDYEAQRHWMEITYNLPIKEWYFETKDNDLQYWGLDYPPLTAYHSLLMGRIANSYNPKYVALNESRGYESPEHKLFMRYTTLFSDMAVFFPAVILHSYFNPHPSNYRVAFNAEIYVMFTYPGLILIDYGHFQYNGVSLGFALAAISLLGAGFETLSCIFYCLAVSYKQMLLYFSLPFFFFHLGKCRQAGIVKGSVKFIKISAVVILTFVVIWYPVASNSTELIQVLKRIFPIDRGVFEDKVSNVWCLINIFFKFRNYLSNETIALICAFMTLIASLPSCVDLFLRPTKHKFHLCLIISSLAFFLFSYQVHEKSILIVALPIMIYFRHDSLHCLWFLIVSTSSMFPLLIKDNLIIAYIGLHLVFIITVDSFYDVTNYGMVTKNSRYMWYVYHVYYKTLYLFSILLICAVILNPPQQYPHLYPLLISAYSALHFLYFFAYFNYVQLFKINKKKS